MAKKILFIEDEPDQVVLVRARFEAGGYEFHSAPDGEKGLGKAQSLKPDLILLDVILPKIDGFEVCKRLKKNAQTKNIPVIILTAVGMKDAEKKAAECGAAAFFKKPYDSKELVKKVKELIV